MIPAQSLAFDEAILVMSRKPPAAIREIAPSSILAMSSERLLEDLQHLGLGFLHAGAHRRVDVVLHLHLIFQIVRFGLYALKRYALVGI